MKWFEHQRIRYTLSHHPIPYEIWKTLMHQAAIFSGLSVVERAHLRELATLFLHRKTLNGVQGLTVSTEMAVTVAVRAADLSRRFGAELILLRVIEHFPEDETNEWIPPENVSPKKYFEEQTRNGLNKLARKLKHEQARQEIIFSNNSARHEIIRFVKENKADLIVLGVHGHSIIGELLMGSTAFGVTQGASCDVLAVRG